MYVYVCATYEISTSSSYMQKHKDQKSRQCADEMDKHLYIQRQADNFADLSHLAFEKISSNCVAFAHVLKCKLESSTLSLMLNGIPGGQEWLQKKRCSRIDLRTDFK
jgi:hypothetical protein